MRATASVVTYMCWAAVGLVWAAGAWRHRQSDTSGERRESDRSSPLAAALAVAIAVSPASWWRPLTVHPGGALIAGLVVVPAATVWTTVARVALGAMWSSGIVARDEHRLRTVGIYGMTRHPVYTGIVGMLVGTSLALGLGRWIALTVVVTLLLVAKARAEERLLRQRFPAEYQRYSDTVPMLIPRRARIRP